PKRSPRCAGVATSPSWPMRASSPRETPGGWRARAADIFSVYPGKHGGIAATLEITHVAKAAGIACCICSNLELGPGTAAMLHVAVADPAIDSVRYPGDLIGPLYNEADLLTVPLELGPEVARLTDGPGLGVQLDEIQLARYRVR